MGNLQPTLPIMGKIRSLRGNIGSQLYSHKCGFKASYPIQKIDGDQFGDTLTQFINNYGVPEHLTFDGASVQTGDQIPCLWSPTSK
jgi:hypothetical protein